MINPQPKRPPAEKPRRQRIAKVSARWDPTFWPGQCAAIREMQAGRCAICGREGSLDTAHIKQLGRTATRNDAERPGRPRSIGWLP